MDLHGSFVFHFNGFVKYDGRANGELGPGNFLLIKKNDNSISIHSGVKITASNYLGASSKLSTNIDTITCEHKKERLIIKIYDIINMMVLNDWSEDEVKLRRTEKELVQKLFWNWPDYFDITCFSIETEVMTDHGPIDLLGTEFDGTKHVIEVKRRKASVTDGGQLRKYVEAMREQNYKVSGYLAAPEIGTKATIYLEKHGYKYVRVGFDLLTPRPHHLPDR